MSTMSRRAILAGTAALSAVTVPALGNGRVADPIFEAIEKHRAAWLYVVSKLKVSGSLMPCDPNYEEANQVTTDAWEATHDAEFALSNITPTTMAGVIALLQYISDFNNDRIKPRNSPSSYTEHENWYDFASDDGGVEMPAPYFMMENALEALQELQKQVA